MSCRQCGGIDNRSIKRGICNKCESIWKRYKLTYEGWQQLISDQNNQCKICGDEPRAGEVLHIDHCHTTGTVRGLLCRSCNLGLGYFRDNKEYLQQAIEYL